MEECVCAIDQGTQSTRVIIFDKTASVIAKYQSAFSQITPRSG